VLTTFTYGANLGPAQAARHIRGTSVAADGTQVDTLIDNLLAESHIRYGGYGGIAYHHIADNYIALFSHFIPCGVWEAVYIIENIYKMFRELGRVNPHDHAAAVHLRTRAAGGDHRRDEQEQGRGLQRILSLAAVRA
jgi:hypothetical protein